MLRITIISEASRATFRLEGRLAGAWVDELRRCYQEVAPGRSELMVDLDEVTFVDRTGKALLREMSLNGVRLMANEPLMESIIFELSQRERS